MKFRIIFKHQSTYYTNPAVEIKRSEIGTDIIDFIRSKTIKNLDISVINKYTNSFYKPRVDIEIPENVARNSGLFKHKNTIIVFLKKDYNLNNYCKMNIKSKINNKTGAYLHVEIEYIIDKEKLINDWIKQCYPTNNIK